MGLDKRELEISERKPSPDMITKCYPRYSAMTTVLISCAIRCFFSLKQSYTDGIMPHLSFLSRRVIIKRGKR